MSIGRPRPAPARRRAGPGASALSGRSGRAGAACTPGCPGDTSASAPAPTPPLRAAQKRGAAEYCGAWRRRACSRLQAVQMLSCMPPGWFNPSKPATDRARSSHSAANGASVVTALKSNSSSVRSPVSLTTCAAQARGLPALVRRQSCWGLLTCSEAHLLELCRAGAVVAPHGQAAQRAQARQRAQVCERQPVQVAAVQLPEQAEAGHQGFCLPVRVHTRLWGNSGELC